MVKIPIEILNKINLFILKLKEKKINISEAYLYGSYANGTYDEWSDIDLALISENFSGNTYEDKIDLIDIIFEIGKDISPYPFTPENFKNSIFARDEILKKGYKVS